MTTLQTIAVFAQTNLCGWRAVLTRPWESAQGCVFVLSVWCGLLFFYGLGAGELWRTEGLRAIIAQEMLNSSDWIVPRLYGEPLFTKPPGMYLAIVLCSWPLGVVSEWSARLPAALAATSTVFLFFAFFRRHVGRPGALAAALILPMSPMWLEKVPSAEIDMLQVMWVTASLVCFFRAVEEEESSGRARRWWYGAMLAMAGGVLTKWTAPAFFYATAVAFLWWRGRLRLLVTRHHMLGLLLACCICSGWIGAAVSRTGWDIFYETVKREGLARLVPNYLRAYPLGESILHPLKLLGTTLPWSLLALLSLRPSFSRGWDERGRFLLQALHAWTWPNVLVWSYIAEHTARHSFPLFPGVAGLAAMVWVAWHRGDLLAASLGRARAASLGKMTLLRGVPPALAQGSRLNGERATARRFLVGMLALWFVIKVVFVAVIVPGVSFEILGRQFVLRSQERRPRDKGEQLASLVPAGKILYLFRLKDEGLMFYYGRAVVRLAVWADLPVTTEAIYCMLVPKEWELWDPARSAEVVQHLVDEQGDPMLLIRVLPSGVRFPTGPN